MRVKIQKEGGNDVLLRSLVREQEEANAAIAKAKEHEINAERLELEASNRLTEANKEQVKNNTNKNVEGVGHVDCMFSTLYFVRFFGSFFFGRLLLTTHCSHFFFFLRFGFFPRPKPIVRPALH